MADEDQTKNAPSPNTAFQPGGVKARDAARRDIAKEMDSIRRMKKLDSQINRAIRRGNPKKAQQFSDLKKAMGGNPFDTAGSNIPNVADTRSQARVNYNEKAEKRFKMGQKEAADAVEPAPVPENLNNGVDGKPVPETQQPYTVGQAKPSEQSPILPNPADELEESVFEKDAREAQERSTESGAFGDQKKQEAFGEKFGHGARDTKQKFLDDLEGSDLIKASRGVGLGSSWDPNHKEVKDAQEKAYKRGDELGITREELQEEMGWETDSEVAEKADKKSKAEQKQRISDEVETKYGTPDEIEAQVERAKLEMASLQTMQDDIAKSRESNRKILGKNNELGGISEVDGNGGARTGTGVDRGDLRGTGDQDASAFFDSFADKPMPKVREAMAPTIGGSLTESIGGEDSVWNKKEIDSNNESKRVAKNKFNESFAETRTVLPSNPRGGTKPKKVTTNSLSKVRSEALSGATPGTSLQDVHRIKQSRKAQDKLISNAIKSNHSLANDEELMALPGFASRYKKAKKEKRDQTSQSLKKEIEAVKPAQLP